MEPVDVDLLAILIAAIVYMIVGFLWYAPFFFGKTWMKLSKVKSGEMKNKGWVIFGSFVNALVLSFFMDLLMGFLDISTVIDGFFVGFGLWLGFIVTTQLSAVFWEKKPFKLYLLDTGYWFVIFCVLGAILGT